MSYKSPITMYTERIVKDIMEKQDGYLMECIHKVGFDINKDELAKALAYDRDQYFKGFSDGRNYTPPNPTNADRIRAMTDEELAEWLAKQEYKKPTFDGWLPLCNHVMGAKICHENGCKECWLDWLKQEVSDG